MFTELAGMLALKYEADQQTALKWASLIAAAYDDGPTEPARPYGLVFNPNGMPGDTHRNSNRIEAIVFHDDGFDVISLDWRPRRLRGFKVANACVDRIRWADLIRFHPHEMQMPGAPFAIVSVAMELAGSNVIAPLVGYVVPPEKSAKLRRDLEAIMASELTSAPNCMQKPSVAPDERKGDPRNIT